MKRGVPIPAKVRKEVFERDRGMCQARFMQYGCLRIGTELNHVKSRARGGSNRSRNLRTLCRPCHVAVTDNKPGTEGHRTFAWQCEGMTERDAKFWREI